MTRTDPLPVLGLTLDQLIFDCINRLAPFHDNCEDEEEYESVKIRFSLPRPKRFNPRTGHGNGLVHLTGRRGPLGVVLSVAATDPSRVLVAFSAVRVLRWAFREQKRLTVL